MRAAVEMSSTDRAPAVSDSDDDRPDKEPEFVIHIVDDQPPAPAPRWPIVFRPPAFPPALPAPQVDDLDGLQCGKNGLIFRIVMSVVVMALAIVMLVLAARVHQKFAGPEFDFLVACPIFIILMAFCWIFVEDQLFQECEGNLYG